MTSRIVTIFSDRAEKLKPDLQRKRVINESVVKKKEKINLNQSEF